MCAGGGAEAGELPEWGLVCKLKTNFPPPAATVNSQEAEDEEEEAAPDYENL